MSIAEAGGAVPSTIRPAIGAAHDEALRLRDYLQILRRRKQLIVVVTLLVLVPAVLFSSLKPPVYAR